MPFEDFENSWEKIGRGAFSQVYKVKRKHDQKFYVIKQITLNSVTKREQDDCVRECEILSGFQHPQIIRYYESFVTKNGSNELFINIVMEYCSQGTVSDLLENAKLNGESLNESIIWKVFLQTLVGLFHVHTRNIIHRDIKPQNLFLSDDINVKIGDFGVSRVLESKNSLCETLVGTPFYLPPELCRNKNYNQKADVWSLGCVLYELCEMKHPFSAKNQAALVLKILKGKYQKTKIKTFHPIISKMLEERVEKRISTIQLLHFPIIKKKLQGEFSDLFKNDEEIQKVLKEEELSISISIPQISTEFSQNEKFSVFRSHQKQVYSTSDHHSENVQENKLRVKYNPIKKKKKKVSPITPTFGGTNNNSIKTGGLIIPEEKEERGVIFVDHSCEFVKIPNRCRRNSSRLLARRKIVDGVSSDEEDDLLESVGNIVTFKKI